MNAAQKADPTAFQAAAVHVRAHTRALALVELQARNPHMKARA
jgi:hypothetical protein